MVAFCIFVVVTLTRAGTFADVQEGLDFIERLLKTFLIGLAVASGVSILVLPSTCRGAVFKDVKIYARDAKTILDSLVDFVQNAPGDTFLVASADSQSNEAAEASRQILSATISKLNALDSRVQSSLKYAKDEIAWGKLDASDLEEMSSLLRNLLRPLSGLGLVPRTRDNFAHIQPLPRHAIVESDKSGRIIEGLRSYSSKARGLISLILSYFLVQLEVGDKDDGTSKEVDFGEPVKLNPADPESIHLLEKFSVTLKSAGRRLTDEILTSSEGGISTDEAGLQDRVKQALQQEYFLALHVISLLDMAVEESLALAYFAQSKVTDSTMLRRRLIYSDLGFRRVLDSCKKLVTRSSHRDKSRKAREEHDAPKVVDPEHLEPANLWERGSGRVGNILGLIGSDLSMFGMRASAASFCIGLLAFLHQTQEFFIHQRGVWAMIVIVIGMSPTSGQSFFGFIARILASVCSVVLSLAAWYIVDGKTPGVIITLFLANIIEVGGLNWVS